MASGISGPSRSEFLVNGKYRLVRKIGSGSFGDIYLGINISNGEVRRAFLKTDISLTPAGLGPQFLPISIE